jgi:hypothetical protein
VLAARVYSPLGQSAQSALPGKGTRVVFASPDTGQRGGALCERRALWCVPAGKRVSMAGAVFFSMARIPFRRHGPGSRRCAVAFVRREWPAGR